MASFIESVRTRGVRPPLLVRRLPDGRVQLLTGRRRLAASGQSVHDMLVLSMDSLLAAAREDSVEARARRLREAAEAAGST